jgi:hypothetical protein
MLSDTRQWYVSGWSNLSQNLYTYDSNNNLTINLRQSWNSGTGTWQNGYQNVWTYDANNNPTSGLHQTWDVNAWVDDDLVLYTHDANNNLISFLFQVWNGTWDDFSQGFYSYDANNNRINYYNQYLAGANWVNSEQYFWTYNANDSLISQLYQQWSAGLWYNKDSTYYYYNSPLAIPENGSANSFFNIFPNPASDQFTVSSRQSTINKIEIINLLGEEVFNKQLSAFYFLLSASSFPNGIYIIKVYTEKGIFQQKLVIAHP